MIIDVATLAAVGGRLDFGLGNPNKAAALLAMMTAGVWVFAFMRHGGFWLALFISGGLGILQIHTLSRGGILATVAGLGCVVVCLRKLRFHEQIAVAVMATALFIYGWQQEGAGRYVGGIVNTDFSLANRWQIWKQVPGMLADAPSGWGLGQSGDAYTQWYQPVGRMESYRTLVGSHFTWLVEFGWLGGLAYILACCSVLVLCWPSSESRWFSVLLGIWISFGVSASFSSIAESPVLWVMPALALLIATGWRWQLNAWPRQRVFLWVLSLGGFLSIALMIAGALSDSPHKIAAHNGVMTVGGTQPQVWIVNPDKRILGDHYGHAARKAQIPLGIVNDWNALPGWAKGKLIVVGSGIEGLHDNSKFTEIVLLNPSGFPPSEGMAKFISPKLTIIWGEFRSADRRGQWEEWAKGVPNSRFIEEEGAGEFLRHWTSWLR